MDKQSLADAINSVLLLMRGARDDIEMATLQAAMRRLVDFAKLRASREVQP